MKQEPLVSATNKLTSLVKNLDDIDNDDAQVIVGDVIQTLQQAIGITSYSDKVKAALSDYLSNGLLDINQSAKNHGVYVGDVRVAFTKHLEERYSA